MNAKFCVGPSYIVHMVCSLLNVALVYVRLPRVVCVVLIRIWRNLSDMGNK